jgi:hypothetical protein
MTAATKVSETIKSLILEHKNSQPATILIPAMASFLQDYGIESATALVIATKAYHEA